MRTTNILLNEYQMSTRTVKCRVENHFLREKATEFEENCVKIVNQAELKAIKEEQIRLEEELKKRKQIEDLNKKLEDNLKVQKISNREKTEEIKKLEQEKRTKAEKIKEYNKKIRVLVEKPRQVENIVSNINLNKNNPVRVDSTTFSPSDNPTSPKFNSVALKNYQTFSFTDSLPKAETYKEEQPMVCQLHPTKEKEFNLNNNKAFIEIHQQKNQELNKKSSGVFKEEIIHSNMSNSNVVNVRDRIMNSIKEKIDSEIVPSQPLEGKSKPVVRNNDNQGLSLGNINDELRRNVDNVKEFRKHGAITYDTRKNPSNKFISEEVEVRNCEKKSSDVEEKYIKQNELEKRR